MSRIKSFLRENWMRVILVVVSLAGLVVAVTSAFGPRSATGEGEVTFIVLETQKEGEATFILWGIQKKVEFKKGDNAFDLFKDQEEFEVEYSDEFGTFTEGINGVLMDDGRFWALYVNNKSSGVGIDDVELTDGIVIEFRFEEIILG